MNTNYYISHSIYSDPGKYLPLLQSFPTRINEISHCIHGLFIHYADLDLFSATVSTERYHEMNLRYLDRIIENIVRIDQRELAIPREPDCRAMGICRDSSLLLCAILRSRSIPARLRSGYVTYFIPGLYLDGILVEYYDALTNRWRCVDTRTAQKQIDYYHLVIDFDLTDVPSDKFISSAIAWKMCRQGMADPARFGSRQYRGLNVMRNRLIQDLALLNKHETLVWDLWGMMLDPIRDEIELLDFLADELLAHDKDVDRMRYLYESHPTIQIPTHVLVDCPFLSQYYYQLRSACAVA